LNLINKDIINNPNKFVKKFEATINSGNINKNIIFYGKIYENHDEIGIVNIIFDNTENKELEKKLFEIQRLDSLGQLVGGIAHDFNNLLSSILGYISLLLGKETDEENIKRLKIVEESGWMMADLTSKLLKFGKRDSGIRNPIDLNDVINDNYQLLENSFYRKNINVSLNLSNIPTIDAEKSEIHQIIMNLWINAIDSLIYKKEEKNIFIETKLKEKKVLLKISDNGYGMDEKIKSKIFEPYFTTKDKMVKKGTGLGLAVVYGLIKKYNGEIIVNSKLGFGSSFEITFPIGQKTQNFHEEDKDKFIKINTYSNKILLYEKTNSGIISDLETLGYECIIINNDKECETLFIENHLDLFAIIIDHKNERLFKIIKNINKDVPIITFGDKFIDSDFFIKKKFNIKELASFLKKLK